VQVAKWSLLAVQAGGLQNEDARGAALGVLKAVCSTIVEWTRSWTIRLTLYVDWQCRWPRPTTAYGDEFVDLQVASHGAVNVEILRDRASVAISTSLLARFFAVLAKGFGLAVSSVNLFDFLRVLVVQRGPIADSFMMQVCMAAAQQLQGALASHEKGKRAVAPLRFQFTDLSGWEGDELDQRLASYVVASVDAIGVPIDLFCASDHGSVGCLPLQVTFFGTNKNVVTLACPQVVTLITTSSI
jgi:hypothetical protein